MAKFSNQLINETSPYLLQHAHNPVNWYPWGEVALQKAIQEDKPILVSIGYSACHWCHVMERESFEDEETARLMNELFVNIKIDREERPDLDHIYMDAVQAMAGSGGWPLNVFLTPSRQPFYGGTYFPPVKAFNRASWKEVLQGVADLFNNKRTEVEAQATELTRHIGGTNALLDKTGTGEEKQVFDKASLQTIFDNIMKQADKKWGGFGRAPKFPQTFTINYLLRYYHFTGNREALDQACLSLDKMCMGGIYDQAGGGFARYSTDTEWLAPHFEKMLYDNALLISVLAEAYQVTKNEYYRAVVASTIRFVKSELMSPEGGFYAALDADSEGEEGKFYVWSYKEIQNILGEDAELYSRFYDISPGGNWEHKNILRVLKPLPEFALEQELDAAKLTDMLNKSNNKLLEYRETRIRPGLDDKLILGWNALMIIALCKAYAAFGEQAYKELAIRNMDFLTTRFVKEAGGYYHTYKEGIAKYPAFLDDYAYLIHACIQLHEITSSANWLETANNLTTYVTAHFSDEEELLFYYTGEEQDDVIIRKKEIYDGAVPSGNSMMCANLFYLSVIYDNRDWKARAYRMLGGIKELCIKYPTSFGNWACELAIQTQGINEIVVAGKDIISPLKELLACFIPNKVMQSTREMSEKFPLLAGKEELDKTLIYLCKDYSCKRPVGTVKELLKEML